MLKSAVSDAIHMFVKIKQTLCANVSKEGHLNTFNAQTKNII